MLWAAVSCLPRPSRGQNREHQTDPITEERAKRGACLRGELSDRQYLLEENPTIPPPISEFRGCFWKSPYKQSRLLGCTDSRGGKNPQTPITSLGARGLSEHPGLTGLSCPPGPARACEARPGGAGEHRTPNPNPGPAHLRPVQSASLRAPPLPPNYLPPEVKLRPGLSGTPGAKPAIPPRANATFKRGAARFPTGPPF